MCPQVPYDLLVGADGANSLIRSQLQTTMPSNYVRRIRHKGVYTTTGVAVPADELPGHAFFEIHSFEVRHDVLDET
jgi:2-polyprenyl-6-methoxyphenol hydroxylase-like FAD-dependent oxidoreductase